MRLPTPHLHRLLVLPLFIALTGCAAYSVVNSDRYSGSSSAVPAEYIPSPGFCRIWYKNRTPEQQPAQGDCDKLKQDVPENAVLLKG
ncbi:hypothetical protein [Methylophaga muralis]|uniref:Lipoprotein n=1 Tax=Methylophaga muralis TaxID=291169 RepID=A0A1E3GSD4_9GAMM|nr:hypothetical protein [Methylophaga muralis]ODN66924.1 hypothetical protein A9E74_01318 [Methylophaga muralis]